MYCANVRAREPLLIGCPATDFVGKLIVETFRPAFEASALIAAGVMSGVPVIFSSLRLSLTVERPPKPIAMAATPNAMRTAPARKPPHSKSLRRLVFGAPAAIGV